MLKPHVDVFAELNPAYLETGYACDYYGIYHVCVTDENGNAVGKPLATFTGASGRLKAYERAGMYNNGSLVPG